MSDELTVDGVAKLTVPLLKAALAARNLPATGLKADLVKRLVDALQQESQAAADPAPVAEAAPAAAPEPPTSPAKPSVQPVAAPEPVVAEPVVAEPAPVAEPLAAPAPCIARRC